jgi:hypothetical protein
VSELRSAIESLRAEVLTSLPDARVEEDFAELQAACDALEVERLRRLAEIDRRRLFERDGYLSAAAWLAGRFRIAWGEARRAVALARSIDGMPLARRAFEDGTVSLSAVRVLAEAAEAEPEAFQAAERLLVDAASRHPITDLRRAVIHWRHVVERERAESDGLETVLRARRRLHASVTLDGMVRLDGDLDPETGETFMTALRAVLDAEARPSATIGVEAGAADDRSPAQRRADALGEICRGWLDRVDRPEVAGERPHLTVTVPLSVLTGHVQDDVGDGRGAPHTFRSIHDSSPEHDHTGTVDPRNVRRLACDASITRVVLGPRSEPIDVGRKTPVVSPATRRAVVARDRNCRFPGCDRPQSWCDAHHIVHWADGGETSLANLVLLCRRHHRLVHERFSVELTEGRLVFRRGDGSQLEDPAGRAPP